MNDHTFQNPVLSIQAPRLVSGPKSLPILVWGFPTMIIVYYTPQKNPLLSIKAPKLDCSCQNPLVAAESFCSREQIHKGNAEQIRLGQESVFGL